MKKNKVPQVNTPRSMDEINKSYSDLISQLGVSEYQIYVHTNNVTSLKQHLLSVNQEAQARQNLDKEAAANVTQATTTAAAPAQGATNG